MKESKSTSFKIIEIHKTRISVLSHMPILMQLGILLHMDQKRQMHLPANDEWGWGTPNIITFIEWKVMRIWI
jgi:hypothetical protein